MTIIRKKIRFSKIKNDFLEKWRNIPPSIAGDCMNRQNIMSERIKPIIPGRKLFGQARTVSVVQGDNSAIHAALTLIKKNEILVVDGGAHLDRAVWGGIMNFSAEMQKIGGVVIDGSIRDIAEIKNMSLSIYAIGCTPAGPTKGGGGKIDYPISCGNVNVNAGDIIIGDDDGIAVIPLEQSEELLKLSINRISMEEKIINKLKNGIEHKVIFDVKEV